MHCHQCVVVSKILFCYRISCDFLHEVDVPDFSPNSDPYSQVLGHSMVLLMNVEYTTMDKSFQRNTSMLNFPKASGEPCKPFMINMAAYLFFCVSDVFFFSIVIFDMNTI